jgi:hypothetical protein
MLLQQKPEIHIENFNFNWCSLTDAERCWIRMWSSPLPPIPLVTFEFCVAGPCAPVTKSIFTAALETLHWIVSGDLGGGFTGDDLRT